MSDPNACKDEPIYQWPPHIRRRGELKVFARPSFTGSVWATDLDKAITTINELLTQGGVYLTFKRADKQDGSLIFAETFPSSDLHGRATLTRVGSRGRFWMDSAKLRVPATPKLGRNKAGQPVRLHILVHELVHCIGLTDCAHSKDHDVFFPALGSDELINTPPPTLSGNTVAKIKEAWPETWMSVVGMALVKQSGEEMRKATEGIDLSKYAEPRR